MMRYCCAGFLLATLMVGLLLQGATARVSESIDFAASTRSLQALTTPTGAITVANTGDYSYWKFALTGNPSFATAPVPSGFQPGFCLDIQHYMTPGASYPCVAYCSSLDPAFSSCIQKTAGTTYNAAGYNLAMDKVNWIINNYFDGMKDGESSCGVGTFTKTNIQEAIWLLTNPGYLSSIPVTDPCRSNYIKAQADLYGVGFVPDKCSQLAAVAIVVYQCGTAGTPLNTQQQLVFFYARLDLLGAQCIPWPKCTQPKLPDNCIGVSYTELCEIVQITNTELRIAPTYRRNLTCGECQAYTGQLPEGCDCPIWPCCGPNIDPPGYNCPPCPAVAFGSTYTKALSGPGGCASAIAYMSGSSVPDAVYNKYKQEILTIVNANNPVAGTTYQAVATAIANATGTAVANAAIKYFQTGCVCRSAPGYSTAIVTSKIYAVALAIAKAYSAARVEIYSVTPVARDIAAVADSQNLAIAASINTAVLQFMNQTQYLPAQCSMQGPVIQTQMASAVTNAVACTIAQSLAAVEYFDQEPLNPYPLPGAGQCSCSVSVAIGGAMPNINTTCPIACPTTPVDPDNPQPPTCVCANGYDVATFGCAP